MVTDDTPNADDTLNSYDTLQGYDTLNCKDTLNNWKTVTRTQMKVVWQDKQSRTGVSKTREVW